MNYIEQVTEMLGVRINQWFRLETLIGDSILKYKFTENGLFNELDIPCQVTLMDILNGYHIISWKE
jgi:hypothetical protein